MRLDIVTVIDNLLLGDRDRKELLKILDQLVANMRALGVLDEHGHQVSGQMIRELQGMDALLIWYILFNHQLEYIELREAGRISDRSRHHPARARSQGRGREARVDADQAARAAVRKAIRTSRGTTSRPSGRRSTRACSRRSS